MTKKFIRQDYMSDGKSGKNRKKLQKWRRPKGRHSKMRKQRKSYPASPTVGYKSSKKSFGKIRNKNPVLVHNLKELESLSSNDIAILAKIGAKKKLDLIKKAGELKIQIYNIKRENKK